MARFFRRSRPQDKAEHRGGTGGARSGVAPRAKNGEAEGKRYRAVVEVGANAGAKDREGGSLVGREEGGEPRAKSERLQALVERCPGRLA